MPLRARSKLVYSLVCQDPAAVDACSQCYGDGHRTLEKASCELSLPEEASAIGHCDEVCKSDELLCHLRAGVIDGYEGRKARTRRACKRCGEQSCCQQGKEDHSRQHGQGKPVAKHIKRHCDQPCAHSQCQYHDAHL